MLCVYVTGRPARTSFDAAIYNEHFGQVSLKFDKSRYPIDSFEERDFAQKQTPIVWAKKIFLLLTLHQSGRGA